MVKKNKSSPTVVGHASMVGHDSEKEMRQRAVERYHNDYGFKRGIRVSSPDRDPYSYKEFERNEKTGDNFYNIPDAREIRMVLGKSHGFAHARTVNDGHSVYGGHKAGMKKGHMIGKR